MIEISRLLVRDALFIYVRNEQFSILILNLNADGHTKPCVMRDGY